MVPFGGQHTKISSLAKTNVIQEHLLCDHQVQQFGKFNKNTENKLYLIFFVDRKDENNRRHSNLVIKSFVIAHQPSTEH